MQLAQELGRERELQALQSLKEDLFALECRAESTQVGLQAAYQSRLDSIAERHELELADVSYYLVRSQQQTLSESRIGACSKACGAAAHGVRVCTSA
jgi:hypothetical protein